jgi:hypothetical protein
MDGLYWEDTSDDGMGNMYLCPTGNESASRCPISANDKIIFYGNFMIGVPRYNDNLALFQVKLRLNFKL